VVKTAEGNTGGAIWAWHRGSSGVAEQGMHSQGAPGNLGEPPVSLLELPEEQGYRLTKSPGAGGQLPTVSEPATGHKLRERTRYWGASDKRSDPRGTEGSRS